MKGLWDAPFFFPLHDTLAFSEHLLGIAIFTAPLQWLTGNAVLAYNAGYLGFVVLAGVGTYLLAVSLWGRRDGAWVAAIAFACAPHRAMYVPHLQVLMSGWMPVGLWGLHRYFRTRSRRVLAVFAAAFVIQALSNGYFLFFSAVPVLVVIVTETLRVTLDPGRNRASRRQVLSRILRELGTAALAIGAVLAPVAAAYGRVRESHGFKRDPGEIAGFSAQLQDYLRRPGHLWVWDALLKEGDAERMLFPGLLIVALAALGLAAAWRSAWRSHDSRDRRRAFHVAQYATILGVAVWLSLGPGHVGPYRLLLAVAPGMDGLRVPARFVVVVALALAVLAGAGAAWIGARLGRRFAAATAAVIAVAVGIEGYSGPPRLETFRPADRARSDLNAWIREAPPGGVVELPIAGPELAPFTLPYQYNTLLHGHPVVNGYSGYGFGLQDFLGGPSTPFRELAQLPHAITALRQIGVRVLVMHPSAYKDGPDTTPCRSSTRSTVNARNWSRRGRFRGSMRGGWPRSSRCRSSRSRPGRDWIRVCSR